MSKAPAKRKSPPATRKAGATVAATPTDTLAADIGQLIHEARAAAATAVNATLTMLYWRVGLRIRTEVLGEKRATYGEEIVATLSRQLTAEHGQGFSAKNLRHMMRFAEVFPDEAIVSALRRQLSWTHFRALIYFDEPQKRDFYAEMCRLEGWSTGTALMPSTHPNAFELFSVSLAYRHLPPRCLPRSRSPAEVAR